MSLAVDSNARGLFKACALFSCTHITVGDRDAFWPAAQRSGLEYACTRYPFRELVYLGIRGRKEEGTRASFLLRGRVKHITLGLGVLPESKQLSECCYEGSSAKT